MLRAQSKSVITAQVLEETPHHRIETFGLPLPVQVSEILANQESKINFLACHLAAFESNFKKISGFLVINEAF